MKKSLYLVMLAVVALISSCKKEENLEKSQTYTAKQVVQFLSQKENWPKKEEVFSLLNLKTTGEKPWKEGVQDKKIKNSESTLDIAFSYGEVVVSFSGDTVKQIIYWSVIENNGGQNYLLEKGTIVKYFDLSINLLKTEFYVGWNSNDPYCVKVNIETNLQSYAYDYISLNFNYPSTYGTLNFQEYMGINIMKIYLPKLNFTLSAEFNSVGKIMEFNPNYQNQININFDVQENTVAIINLCVADYGIGENTQIVFFITDKDFCEEKKEMLVNIGETLPDIIQIPLSFEPEEVGFFTKIFCNGIIEYGQYRQQKAVVISGPIPQIYQLEEMINMNPFYDFYVYTHEEMYNVYHKVKQIPEDPTQYQGNLEDLKDDLLDYVDDMVNSMETYNEELEDFVESYQEELTSCQKNEIINITGWILNTIQKTTNQIEEIVEIYELEMPGNWLEELEETLAQTNQILIVIEL